MTIVRSEKGLATKPHRRLNGIDSVVAKAILENSPLGISVRDRNGRLLYYNQAWQDIWGLTNEEVESRLANKPARLSFDAKDRYLGEWQTQVENLYANGGHLHIPAMQTSDVRSGMAKWVSQHFYALRNDAGEVVRVVILTQDVTERVQLEELRARTTDALEMAVSDSEEQLQRTLKELESFGYSIAHDLKGPLRSIDGFSKILQEDLADNASPGVQESLSLISKAALRMESLIDGLLHINRVSLHKLDRQSVDLSAFVTATHKKLVQEYPNTTIELTVPNTMPVNGDPHLLSIIIEELMSNACKFSSTRSQIHLHIDYCFNGEEATVTVKDNGVGFDLAYSSQLFHLFGRLHKQSEFPGHGVGLAVVKRAIERHGGHVSANSKLGEGAQFWFTLPI